MLGNLFLQKTFKRELEVENWIKKYDDEMGEKQVCIYNIGPLAADGSKLSQCKNSFVCHRIMILPEKVYKKLALLIYMYIYNSQT